MSSGSDWVNLFVHQGKELLESVARQRRKEAPEAKPESLTYSQALLNASEAESGLVILEENVEDYGVMDGPSSSAAPVSEASGVSVQKMTLNEGDKAIYENQLEQLQEQLVDIMIKNQEMDAELASLRNSDVSKLTQELEREKIKRKQLEVKLKRTKSDDEHTPKLRRRKLQNSSAEQNDQSTSSAHQMTENIEVPASSQGDPSRVSLLKFWFYRWYLSLSQSITLTFWNIMSDMSDDDTQGETVDEEGPPLAVKTLKDNVNRFSLGIMPIREFFKKLTWVLSWKNPAATMLIFLVYVFSFWHGYTVTLLLFLVIVQLSANYIYCRFGTISEKNEREVTTEPASWSDRFQVVLHVARKVQNVLGMLSDHLEKIKNLLTWKVQRVTLKLYIVLWLLFVTSVLLSGPQFFTLLGMMLGYKLFITNPLYTRFPKLKKRYDTTHHLWLELPNDCEASIEADKQTEDASNSHQASLSMISENSALSSQLFCERYKLTSDEILVKGWEEGWRSSLMNKHKPLVNIKHGRLYLTQNYLCFERSRTNITKNILIKLSDIRCVNKYKPLYILPGTGMSIEVCMKNKDEPYIFGAIIGRDDAYNDIIQTAKDTGLSWAK